MIAPAGTLVPSYTFTPSRLDFESRPLRVEPPPFVLDTRTSLSALCASVSAARGDRDRHDLDRGVLLAVAPAAPATCLGLVGEAPDLRTELLPHDSGGHHGPGELGRGGQDPVVVDDEHRSELDLAPLGDPEKLDAQLLALGHALLLASTLDDCIHNRASLQQGVVEHDPAAAAHGTGDRQRLDQTLGDPLPGHLDQAQLRA